MAVALVVAVAVGFAAFAFGRLSTLGETRPAGTSAEAGFARDMQVHHNQGVELALLIRDRTDDDAVRLLAYDIATTQAQQSGQMYGWLSSWGLPQAGSEPSMAWMSRPGRSSERAHEHATSQQPGGAPALMPGLATPEQVARLTAASGVDAERIFLTLMIAHHRGAVEMAEAVLDRSDNRVVRSLATGIVASQKSEIDLMTSMLADRA